MFFFLTSMASVFLLLLPTLPGRVFAWFEIFTDMPVHWTSVESVSTIAMIMMFAISVWLQLKLPLRTDIPAGA
jgi:hypothetical protein